jgi:hypothetical protein
MSCNENWREPREFLTPDSYYEYVKERTIAQQRAKLETYDALKQDGLPIPSDLKYEIEHFRANG